MSIGTATVFNSSSHTHQPNPNPRESNFRKSLPPLPTYPIETVPPPATAGVARAVGVQGSIIGPTHAISAALTSLKGAARRVRKGASGNRNNGNDSGSGGAGTAAAVMMVEEGEEEEEEDGGNGDDGRGEGVAGELEGGGGGYGGDSTAAREMGEAPPAAADTVVGGELEGSVFGEEARRYEVMLEAMLRGAVEVRRGVCCVLCLSFCV